MDLTYPEWTTPQPDWLHSSEETLPIRSEQCQNTKFSRSRHWKWPQLADDDPSPSSEKNQRAKTHKFDLEKLKDPNVLEKKLRNYDRRKIQTWTQLSPSSTQQWLKQPVRSWANIVIRKKNWVIAEIIDLCDKKRELRKNKFEPEGSEKYKEVNDNHQDVHEKGKPG